MMRAMEHMKKATMRGLTIKKEVKRLPAEQEGR